MAQPPRERNTLSTSLSGIELSIGARATLEPDAALAADTIEVATLFQDEATAISAAKLAALEAFLGAVLKDCKFGEFMREILLTILRTVKSEAGSLLELDYKSQCFFFRAVIGQSSDQIHRFVVPLGQGIVGHVAESKQPLVVDDIHENRLHLKAIQNAVGFETRNMAAVPIIIRGRVFAVLELLNRIGAETYSANDIELLIYLCGTAAKAIEARLTLNWALRRRASGGTGTPGEAA